MAFTTGNDVNILQASDSTNLSAGAGDDRYILSGDLLTDGQLISISDVEGANTIQLVGGLSITSSSVAADAAQLTLSNGAVITLLGASSFTYQIGGDSLTGTGGASQDYSTFVTTSLGLDSVPAEGEAPVDGTAVDVNEDGTTTGGSSSAYTLTAAADSVDEGSTATFNLTSVDVAEGTEVAYTISGVDAADVDGGSLTGTATIAADGTATISVALLADSATEGAETLTVTLDGTSVSDDVTVNDTSTDAASFTLTTSADSVNEGANVSVTITGSEGAVAGDEVAYTITGIDAADLVSGSLTGTATLAADLSATVTLELVADLATEGEETLTFALDGEDVSTNITVNDTSTQATFNLTTGVETVTGTDGGDAISGVASSLSSERTLDTGDLIDGGAGDDTLDITMNSSFSGFTSTGGVSNVENIQLTNATTIGRTFDASGVTGVSQYTIDASNGAVSLSDLVESAAVTVNGQESGSFTVSFQDVADTAADVVGQTDDAMTLSLSGLGVVEDTSTTTVERKVVTATINNIEELTIDSTGANVISLGSDSAKSIIVTGSGSIEIDDVGTALTAFDASAAESGVTVDATAAAAGKLESIKTGAGSDKITLNSGDLLANATIAGGEGSDTVIWNGATATTQVSMTGVENIQLGTLTGDEVLSGTNISGVEKVTVDDSTSSQDAILANMGSGDIEVALVGANANGSSKSVSVDASGAATVNITADTTTLEKGTANTAAQDNGFDVVLGKAGSLVVNAGAYTDSQSTITASEAASVTVNVASGKDANDNELSDFSGTVNAAEATSVAVSAEGNFSGSVEANKASSVVYTAVGKTTGTTLGADTATSVELTTGTAASDVKLNIAKAETLSVNAGGDLTVTSDDNFEAVQELTVETAGAFSTGSEAYAKIASLQASGDGTTSAVTVGALGGENDYNLSIVATGLKGGLTATTVQTGATRDISITTSGMLGNVTTGKISGSNAGTTDVNNVTLTSAGNVGNVQYGAISADGTVTIANSSTGSFTVGNIGEAGALPSTVSLNLDGTIGAISLGTISGGTVTIDASSATGAMTYDDITVTKALTLVGNELKANDFATTTKTITLDTTSNEVTVSASGGIAADKFVFDVSNATKGIGSFVVDGGVGTDELTIGGTTANFATTKATISGIETINVNDAGGTVSINGSAISGQTIDLIGVAAGDDLSLTGTDSADTIDLSNMTTSGNNVDLMISAGNGNDTIKLTAATVSVETVTLGTTNTTNGTDSITNFTAGEDFITFNFAGTNELANIAALRGTGADLDTDGGTAGNGLNTNTGFLTSSAQQADLEVSTAITYLTTYEGSTASSDLVANDELYFALDNGTDTAIYYYHDADGGADVDSGEVFKVATLVGLAAAETITGTETTDFT